MMDITYCSRTSCGKLSCERNQYNAPKNKDISIANLDNGCFGLAENPDKFYYCGLSDCLDNDCRFHLSKAPVGVVVEALCKSGDCYVGPSDRRIELLKAICRGTQRTAYRCNDVCKAMCGNDGTCAYCATIADAIEEAL